MAFPTGWGRKCELVVQSSKVTSDCTDFPVLVTEDTLPSEIFDADGSYPALSGGGDLRFSSDSAGNTQLPCEVITFIIDNDPANGVAEVWVKRTLSSSSNTSIWIWYNKSGESQPAEDNAYGKENVWKSAYKLVHHMNQDPSGSSPQMIDSTLNDCDGTTYGTMTTSDLISSQIGNGLNFDGSDDRVELQNESALDGFTSITISAWLTTEAPTGDHQVISKRSAWSSTGIPFEVQHSGHFQLFNKGSGDYVTGSTAIASQTYYVVCTWDGSNQSIYLDGAHDVTESASVTITDNNTNITIGAKPGGGEHWNGIIDEVRVSNIACTSGWITTEYNNQKTPSTFLVEGTPSTPAGGNASTGVFQGPLWGPFGGPIHY